MVVDVIDWVLILIEGLIIGGWIDWVIMLVVVDDIGIDVIWVCGEGVMYWYLFCIVMWFLSLVGDCFVGGLIFGIIVDIGDIIEVCVVCWFIFCNDFKGL